MLLMLLLILHKPTWILASAYPLAPSPQVPPFSPFPTSMSASSPGSMKILTFFLIYFLVFRIYFFRRQSCLKNCHILNVDTFLNKNVCVCFISYVFLFHLLSMSHYLFLSFLMMKLVFNSFKFKFENSIKALNADNI